MLLIPDIHITSKYADRIIDRLRTYIDSHPDDTDIIFLGDYVYAFSYDRKALLQLFELRIMLHHQGKNLYILAGNHDRIGDQFVYEQAKQSRDIINHYSTHKIYFITRPQIHHIQGQTIFFLPFVIDPSMFVLDEYETQLQIDHHHKATGATMSHHLNDFVGQALKQIGTCTMIHHYYVAQTEFWPGSGVFDLGDVALDKKRLDYDGLQMISGHIHHPFTYRNYLCLGSVWHTSDRESDQLKILAHRSPANHEVTISESRINPIIRVDIDEDDVLDVSDIMLHLNRIITDHHLTSNQYWTIKSQLNPAQLNDLKVQCHTTQTFAETKEHIDHQLWQICRQLEIKKQSYQVSALVQDLQIQHKKLQMSLTERRTICKTYIQAKYPQDYQIYIDILASLKIL